MGPKKSGLLVANAPQRRFTHPQLELDVLLDYLVEVIGHGHNASLLRFEQLELLSDRGERAYLQSGRAFLSHGQHE
jgi:hypothetical protein